MIELIFELRSRVPSAALGQWNSHARIVQSSKEHFAMVAAIERGMPARWHNFCASIFCRKIIRDGMGNVSADVTAYCRSCNGLSFCAILPIQPYATAVNIAIRTRRPARMPVYLFRKQTDRAPIAGAMGDPLHFFVSHKRVPQRNPDLAQA
jgi:hypothetical protein